MHARQQNYQFAYCYVPALLFRSDFAAMLARFYPAGFGYLEAAWKRLAEFYPPEHVVGEDGFEVASFTISSGVLAILVTMPPAERDLEVTHLVIVIQPQLSYFTVGNSLDQTRTLRSVDARGGNARRGGLYEASAEGILASVCRALDLEPEISPVDGERLRAIADSVPVFNAPSRDPNDAFVLGAMYHVISEATGDTSGLAPAFVPDAFARLPRGAHRKLEKLLRTPPGGSEPEVTSGCLYVARAARISKVLAAIAFILGIIGSIAYWMHSQKPADEKVFTAIAFPLLLTFLAVCASMGTAVLFAPRDYFESEDGQDLMNMLGTKSVTAGRLVILAFLAFGAFIFTAVAFMSLQAMLAP